MLAAASFAQTVSGPRPLADAADWLQARRHWRITYEDPLWEFPGDMVETLPGKRAFDRPSPTFLGIRPAQLDLSGLPASPGPALRQLVERHDARANPGHFTVREEGGYFHILPSAAMDRYGRLKSRWSLLETVITIPKKFRMLNEGFRLVGAAVSRETGVYVDVSTGGLAGNAVDRSMSPPRWAEWGVERRTARQALMNLLGQWPSRYTWRLFCEPSLRGKRRLCVVNILLEPGQTVRPPATPPPAAAGR